MTSERQAPKRHWRTVWLVLLCSERCGPTSQTYWETETGLIPNAFLRDWVPASKQTSLWPWLPGLIPHWQVQNKSQRCRGSSTRVSAGFGSWVWRDDLGDWGGDCDTPLGLSQRACSPTTAAAYSCQCKGRLWGEPATSRRWVRLYCADTPPTTAAWWQMRLRKQSTCVVCVFHSTH